MPVPPVGVAPLIVKLWPLHMVLVRGLTVFSNDERLLICTVSLVAAHTLLLIVQMTLVIPGGRLVMAEPALLGWETMAVEGAITVHVPVPIRAVFPERTVEEELHISLSKPAFAVVAAPETVITTVSDEIAQPASFTMLHLSLSIPIERLLIMLAGRLGEAITGVGTIVVFTIDQVPVS